MFFVEWRLSPSVLSMTLITETLASLLVLAPFSSAVLESLKSSPSALSAALATSSLVAVVSFSLEGFVIAVASFSSEEFAVAADTPRSASSAFFFWNSAARLLSLSVFRLDFLLDEVCAEPESGLCWVS